MRFAGGLREALLEGAIPKFLKGLDGLLTRGGGQYFADGRLTVADIKVFVGMRYLGKGVLDHIPTDTVERIAPALAEHRDRIAGEPRVVAYYSR